MPIRPMTLKRALAETKSGKRHLLLGNGFSIALFPDRFQYGSLLAETDFSKFSAARKAFDRLGTTDFEVVINALRNAVALLPLYSKDTAAAARMQKHAGALKELLVQAIAGRRPERPSDISDRQYVACRAFLAHFVGEKRKAEDGKDLRGCIYTLNYDLLLYWTLLHEAMRTNSNDPFNFAPDSDEGLKYDDGFRAPEDELNAPYVTWEAEGAADRQNIHFLH